MKNPKILLFVSFIANVSLVLVLPVVIVGIVCLINAVCIGGLYLYINDTDSKEKPFISKHAAKAISHVLTEAKNDARFIFEDDDNALEAVEYMLAVLTIDFNRLTKKE